MMTWKRQRGNKKKHNPKRQRGSENMEVTAWKLQRVGDNVEVTMWNRQLGSDNMAGSGNMAGSDNVEATTQKHQL